MQCFKGWAARPAPGSLRSISELLSDKGENMNEESISDKVGGVLLALGLGAWLLINVRVLVYAKLLFVTGMLLKDLYNDRPEARDNASEQEAPILQQDGYIIHKLEHRAQWC